MDVGLQSHIERLFTILAKRRGLQLDRDRLKEVLFDVPRHLFIEQYYATLKFSLTDDFK